MPKRRLGVALLVPQPYATEVDGLRRALGDRALGRIATHLTLIPPVNVRDDRLGEGLAVLRRAAAASASITVTLGPPATFLPVNPVVYLAVQPGPGLDAVHRLRDAVFAGPLERRLMWSFVPHVTVADEAPPERIAAALEALAGFSVDVTFDRLHLLEQDEGRIWRPLAEMAFERPAIIGRGGLELELTTSLRLDPEAADFAGKAWRRSEGDEPVDLAVAARRDGAVVATATGWTRGRLANLSELVVAGDSRGEGIGTHIVARFLAGAAGRGAEMARLRTDSGGPAEAFYRSRGWREEARYTGPAGGLDIVQLTRSLSPTRF